MNNKSYTTNIEVDETPAYVFNCISDVTKWWSKDFEGHSARVHDEFIIMHPGAHYSKQKLFEVIPGRKIVWLVTESHLDWLEKNKGEWTNTKMVFELTPEGDKTILHFTHEGLVPEKECYARCAQGWDMVIKKWLFDFITKSKDERSMRSEFVYVIYIKTTQEQLWHSITDPEIIKQWWGGGITVMCNWEAGALWAMSYEDGREADTGEILEIAPPGRMVIKWRNESNRELKEEGFSICTIDLAPADEAIKLTVTHGMDIKDSKFIATVSHGWPLILSNLKSLLEIGEVALKDRTDNYGRGR